MPPVPDLLAGPIVRRAEPDCVWIWVATRHKLTGCTATVERWFPEHRRRDSVPLKPIDVEALPAIQLGKHLFVSLLPLRPARGTYSFEDVYVYDLELTLEGAPKRTLKDLLESDHIAYEPFKGPTFRLPARWRPIVHGSCRRPGAYGEDAFLALDHRLAAIVRAKEPKTATYPQALFLTGDQIYADDVAGPLFAAIRELAPLLFGMDETVPIPERLLSTLGGVSDGRRPRLPLSKLVYTAPAQKKAAPINTRRGFARKVAGFSTDDGEGHLLGLSEYAAMYLLVWSGVLCRAFDVDNRGKPKGGGDQYLAKFSEACTAARRVLANIPTYMIFDDHDVTDDWNLSKGWLDDTSNQTGQRVIANALAAYWAFQAIGNQPELADDPDLAAFRRYVDMVVNGPKYEDPSITSAEFAKAFVKKRDWGFVAPTLPAAAFVDTRTQRDLRASYKAAHLLPPDALRRLIDRLGAVRPGDDLILVVPCPIQPDRVMLIGQLHELKPGTPKVQMEVDAEHFWLDPAGPFNLIDAIARHKRPRTCFIYSGDVHHGYVMSSIFLCFADGKKFRRRYEVLKNMVQFAAPSQNGRVLEKHFRQSADRGLRVVLVTSSPIKNYSSRYGEALAYFRDADAPRSDVLTYGLGEWLFGKEWYVFTGKYRADGAYLDIHRHHAITDDGIGWRPFGGERAFLAPHFSIVEIRPGVSRTVARFIGAWRFGAKDPLHYWTAKVDMDLDNIVVP